MQLHASHCDASRTCARRPEIRRTSMKSKRFPLVIVLVAIVAIVSVIAASSGGAQKRASAAVASGSAISIAQTPVGKALVGANGRALYLFLAEQPKDSPVGEGSFVSGAGRRHPRHQTGHLRRPPALLLRWRSAARSGCGAGVEPVRRALVRVVGIWRGYHVRRCRRIGLWHELVRW